MAASTNKSEKSKSDQFVIDFINSKFGSDLKLLKSVKSVYDEYETSKKNLEKQLSLASSEVPNEIEKAIHDAEGARHKVKQLGERQEYLHQVVVDQISSAQQLTDQASKLTQEITQLEKLFKYLTCVLHIDHLSTRIQTGIVSDSVTECVEAFMEMTALFTSLNSSRCQHLISFTKETTMYWYKILRNKLASDFEETLKLMKWPLVVTTIKTPVVHNSGEVRQKMEQLFKQLLKLQLPEPLCREIYTVHPLLSHVLGGRSPILPLQLMIKPLRRRFKYHFYGKKQTNDIGKPEWYFTQVLSWLRDHADFLDQRIQPLLKETGRQDVDAKVEFMLGMVTLVMEKMVTDLPEVMNDDHQFSHLVDEALLFDREIRHSYGYSPSLPGSLHILSEEKAFNKWIHIEKKFAIEKLDGMLSSPTAWESQYRHIADVDELKVPECGESFMTLMLTITDRYKPLPHPSHKLQFLDLQLELMEDFRVRLVQVKDNTHNPLSGRFASILNTAYYISEVLTEWSELVFFLQLQFYRMETAEAGTDTHDQHHIKGLDQQGTPFGYTTVFEDTIQLFTRLRNDMLNVMVNHVFTDVRARSKPYKDDRWISLPYQKDLTLGLSTSACEMLLVLKDHLLEVAQLISKPLFNQFWEKITERLNQFVYEEVILRNKFNQGGAAQLQFDMTRNLFPLFGEYTPKPDSYFRDVKEACTLLNLNVGSAILLKEALNDALHKSQKSLEKIDEARAALHDVGVFKLTLNQSELVLSLRTNLVT